MPELDLFFHNSNSAKKIIIDATQTAISTLKKETPLLAKLNYLLDPKKTPLNNEGLTILMIIILEKLQHAELNQKIHNALYQSSNFKIYQDLLMSAVEKLKSIQLKNPATYRNGIYIPPHIDSPAVFTSACKVIAHYFIEMGLSLLINDEEKKQKEQAIQNDVETLARLINEDMVLLDPNEQQIEAVSLITALQNECRHLFKSDTLFESVEERQTPKAGIPMTTFSKS